MHTSKPIDISDLEDRDPNALSEHLQVSWDEVIGEPESIRSPECAWRVSNQCFNVSKNGCYIFLAVILAPVVAFFLGCVFACLAFEHIWCITPCLRVVKISCAALRTFVSSCAAAIVVPCAGALGAFWSHVEIRTHAEESSDKREEDVLLV